LDDDVDLDLDNASVDINNADVDNAKEYATGRIYPVYSEMNGIKPGWFAEKMRNSLSEVNNVFSEYLPDEFLKKFKLMNVTDTITNMHYPEDVDKNRQAKYRVFFDRLLRIQLFSLINRDAYQK